MYTGGPACTGIISIVVVLALMMGGCESEQANTDEPAIAAGHENVDAMSREHANDSSEASAAAEIGPSRPVISQMMAYTEHNDELIYGYFAAPTDMFEPLPAVIVIHEWWGLNDNMRAMADRLAGEGYIVFAVDLFHGKLANTPSDARVLMLDVVEDPDPAKENIKAAIDFVSNVAAAPRVGLGRLGFRWWLVIEIHPRFFRMNSTRPSSITGR